ncbi:hypothetical protein [Argonema galeatum]|uniref:hypothetical protein n=1 Tax=Argonema galeatum TaxID=2942762 RepID=UPI0020132647|nr:hypothetical protein [Argonema galeatum]MCL1464921.1 hypothetical protein [Argonema galeatum A003/A1]
MMVSIVHYLLGLDYSISTPFPLSRISIRPQRGSRGRGAGGQRGRGAEGQGGRGAEEQRSRGAEGQRGRGEKE